MHQTSQQHAKQHNSPTGKHNARKKNNKRKGKDAQKRETWPNNKEVYSSPLKKQQPIDKCRVSLFDKLKSLSDRNILRQALMPGDSTFEILEFYGDSVLYERISFFIMQTRRFMSPHLLTKLRCSVIMNKNLATCFDTLGLQHLLDDPSKALAMKEKADIVEAIIGELSEVCIHNNNSVDVGYIKGVLDEFLAYISYTGERMYFLTQTQSADSNGTPEEKHMPRSKRDAFHQHSGDELPGGQAAKHQHHPAPEKKPITTTSETIQSSSPPLESDFGIPKDFLLQLSPMNHQQAFSYPYLFAPAGYYGQQTAMINESTNSPINNNPKSTSPHVVQVAPAPFIGFSSSTTAQQTMMTSQSSSSTLSTSDAKQQSTQRSTSVPSLRMYFADEQNKAPTTAKDKQSQTNTNPTTAQPAATTPHSSGLLLYSGANNNNHNSNASHVQGHSTSLSSTPASSSSSSSSSFASLSSSPSAGSTAITSDSSQQKGATTTSSPMRLLTKPSNTSHSSPSSMTTLTWTKAPATNNTTPSSSSSSPSSSSSSSSTASTMSTVKSVGPSSAHWAAHPQQPTNATATTAAAASSSHVSSSSSPSTAITATMMTADLFCTNTANVGGRSISEYHQAQ